MNNYDAHMRRRGPTDTIHLDAVPQFKRYYHGERIKVEGPLGVRFGVVGMSTGPQPVFLLVHRITDTGSWDTLGPDDKIVGVKVGSHYEKL